MMTDRRTAVARLDPPFLGQQEALVKKAIGLVLPERAAEPVVLRSGVDDMRRAGALARWIVQSAQASQNEDGERPDVRRASCACRMRSNAKRAVVFSGAGTLPQRSGDALGLADDPFAGSVLREDSALSIVASSMGCGIEVGPGI